MKLFYFLAFLTLSVSADAQSKDVLDKFKKLTWLEGTWIDQKPKPGQTGHERWIRKSTTEFRGFGVTMKSSDTLFVEKLRIITKDDQLYYVADVPENQKPVLFKLTEITDGSFVCENLRHDFPKKIEYTLDGNQLKARISGNGKAIDFLFYRRQ